MATRRRFNKSERFALYLASGGVCAICGSVLETGWHADHMEPFSKGGITDVVNGQALCASCNLAKGSTLETFDDSRQWQKEAAAAYIRRNERDFLLVATPGAGKTRFALNLAQSLLSARTVDKLVVVVPTSSLRHQWALTAEKYFGVKLDDKFLNSHYAPATDFDGVVVTYQQVAANPLIFRRLMSQNETFAIFDEIHHAGHASGWGTSMLTAFNAAARRLSITGTPFRSDNQQIPFTRYDAEGRSEADYEFSYADATRTNPQVCRDMFFHMYGGEIRWEDDNGIQSHILGDVGSEATNSKTMRAALSLESKWLPEVLQLADSRLLSVRDNEYPEAAGLVLARDRFHALKIADYMEEAFKERPFVVVSDNPDDDKPSELIKRFASGDYTIDGDPYARIPRWMVAVRMVSEGIDIPRLTVGVYATNYLTELFFRQAVGRFVRVTDDAPGIAAYLFVPKHPTLNTYAEQIAEERNHTIVFDEGDEDGISPEPRERKDQLFDYFNPLPSHVDPQGIIVNGKSFTRLEYTEALNHKRDVPSFRMFSDEQVMVMIRDLKIAGLWREDSGQDAAQPSYRTETPPTLREQKEEAKGRIRSLVRTIMKMTGTEYKDVYGALNRQDSANMTKATLDQLNARVDVLHGWINEQRVQHAS